MVPRIFAKYMGIVSRAVRSNSNLKSISTGTSGYIFHGACTKVHIKNENKK